MMNRGENSDSIPSDVILDILSRLPSKSIGKFLCVSKLWESMLQGPIFSELFLTRSSARPRLLFAIQHRYLEWSFYSSSSPEATGTTIYFHTRTTDFHTKFISGCNFSYCCGLIYFPKMRIPKEDKEAERVICNPITGQYKILPELRTNIDFYSYLGFDPIDKQFKLLVMSTIDYIASPNSVHHILTLGDEKLMRWRKIQCPFEHEPLSQRICINGVLYYLAFGPDDGISYVIVCFDVRSEIFKFLDSPSPMEFTYLINYKGKLGAISLTDVYHSGMSVIKLGMWVLEDFQKQEWSKYVYTLPQDVIGDSYNIYVAGVTARDEIVLFQKKKPFDAFYFNTEKNALHVMHGNGDHTRLYAFVDHVEALNFDIMKTTSIRPPPEQMHMPTTSTTTTSTIEDHQVKTTTSTSSGKDHQVKTVAHHPQQDCRTFESINRFNALCLLDDDGFTGDKTCESDTSYLQVEDELKDDDSLKLSSSRSDTLTHKQTMKRFKLKLMHLTLLS